MYQTWDKSKKSKYGMPIMHFRLWMFSSNKQDMRRTSPKPCYFNFFIFQKRVLINFILFKFVLGYKIICVLQWANCLKKFGFYQFVFLKLCSIEIFKLLQNPAILLIHYFQKNPGN